MLRLFYGLQNDRNLCKIIGYEKRRAQMYTYYTKGVCSSKMEIELEGNKIRKVNIVGGCNGNLQGLSRLVEGLSAKEAMEKLRGIHCGTKQTSCPDQLSIALEYALEEQKKK